MAIVGVPTSCSAFFHRILIWVLLAISCSAILRFMLMLDLNKRVYNHTPGPCRVIREVGNGSAGIEFIPHENFVFITSGLGNYYGLANVVSGIFTYSLADSAANKYFAKKVTLKNFDTKQFAPLGISSYVSKGRMSLYVVNRAVSPNCVEIFSYNKEENSATHRRSVCDSRFTNLHDILAVGADRFFVTNTAFFENKWMRGVEIALQVSLGSVYLYDGKQVLSCLSGISSPSALAIDTSKNLLYVGSILSESIKVYTLSADLSLTPKIEISLLTSPLGLHVDEQSGEIWVSALPVFHSAFFHVMDPADKQRRSPSQVLRVRIQEGGQSWVVTEPYANDGATVSASASVFYSNQQLLIGSLFGRLLHCDVVNPQIT